MRAALVVFGFLMAAACGGRTLDDGSYEGSGGDGGVPGSGAASNGARANAPSGGSTPTPAGSGGAPSGGPGGRAGGVGVAGGSAAGGSTGGSVGVGGSAGSSGAAAYGECADLCKAYALSCTEVGWDDCMLGCTTSLSSLLPGCHAAQLEAMACYRDTFLAFPMQCAEAEESASNRCAALLGGVTECRLGACPSEITVTENLCWFSQFCADATYSGTCVSDGADGVTCECAVNGKSWSGVNLSHASIEQACWDPDVVAQCTQRR